MRFSCPIPHMTELKAFMQPWEFEVTAAEQRQVAQLGDALGYDMVSVAEHFVVPNSHVDLSGGFYFDATTAKAFIAGATKSIRVNSCITILPLHHPIMLAKQLATLDWWSGGRAMATFAVGWDAEEFEMLGVPFHQRGRLADEYLQAMIELWTSDDPTFEGHYVSFKDVTVRPRPQRPGGIDFWIGGDSDAALRRAARFAHGWWPAFTKPEDLKDRIDFIKSQPEYDGRPFEVMFGVGTERVGEGHVVNEVGAEARPGMSKEHLIDRIGWLSEQGVTSTSVPIPPVSGLAAYLDHLRWVIEEIKPNVPDTAGAQ